MQKSWSYKNYEIKEGLKPGSSQFRYFFVVSESGEKKCNYCIWIVDEALPRLDQSKDFNSIVSSQIETWKEWVKGKIDSADFRNRAFKYEKTGEIEIDLSEMAEHVTME
jgi:chemotaxis regulatin CheY-phosphate phosphatase CheZ